VIVDDPVPGVYRRERAFAFSHFLAAVKMSPGIVRFFCDFFSP
jgi:hypothetical protein